MQYRAYRKVTGENVWIRSHEKPNEDYVFIETFETYVHGRAIAKDIGDAINKLKIETKKEIDKLTQFYNELENETPNYILDVQFDKEKS